MSRLRLDAAIQSIDDLAAIPAIARAAEEAGFAGLWASEVNHDPFIQLALAAAQTARIELGTAIALSFTRSPMSLAYTCWDLAALTGGRFILGLGTQVKAHNERRFSVPWNAPAVPRLTEVIEGLRAIWHSWRTGEKLDYRGEHYRFTLMTPFFTPPRHQHTIPIYIAGVNTGLCRLAGRLCDGFHVHPLHSVKYLNEIVRPAISEGAASAGRSLSDVTLSASVFIVTGRSESEIAFTRELVRQQISFYASTPSYAVVFDLHGWSEVRERLSEMAARKQWGEMPALISDEMIETFALVAGPDEIGAAALERYSGLIDRLTFYLPYIPGQHDAMWQAALAALTNR
ncbi:MAG: LLM class F420-dependent oxidoreductase [Anaerolineae bacterium]